MNGVGYSGKQHVVIIPDDASYFGKSQLSTSVSGGVELGGENATEGNSSCEVVASRVAESLVPSIQVLPLPQHTCEICRATFKSQFTFYKHLKDHYENVPSSSENFGEGKAKRKPDAGTNERKACERDDPGWNGKTAKVSAIVVAEAEKLKETVTNIIEDVAVVSNLTLKPSTSQLMGHLEKGTSKINLTNTEKSQTILRKKCSTCGKNFRKEKSFELHIARCKNGSCKEKKQKSRKSEEYANLRPQRKLHENIARDKDRQDNTKNEEGESDGLDIDTYLDVQHDEIDDDEEETEMMYLSSNICPSCDEQHDTQESLDQHILSNHPEVFLIDPLDDNCKDIKKKRYALSKPLIVPEVKKSNVLKCQQCPRIFNHRNSLVYHMRSHTGERPFACDVCPKRFFATSALKVHKRLHSGEKPYSCNECGREFRQWGDLKYHKISIHSDEKAHQCEFCGKSFARKYSLIVHRRIHTGERNYRCEYCSKTFRAASYLQNHRRIHTGEKPHPCTICGKSFRVRSDMKRHMTSHTRDLKTIATNIANSLTIATVPSVNVETSAKITSVISSLNDASVFEATPATLPIHIQHLPVITTASSEVLTKEPLVSSVGLTECKTESPDEICVSVVNTQTQDSILSNAGTGNAFNVTLVDNGVHPTSEILATTMVSEAMTLYQDTGQNLEIFAASDAARSNTVVLVPLNHTFIQE